MYGQAMVHEDKACRGQKVITGLNEYDRNAGQFISA